MLRLLTPMIGAALLVSLAAPAEAIIPPDVSCAKGTVAITFDDGPSKANTPKLLKILRHNHAQATFFVQGQNVRRYPKIVRAIVRDGHAVEVHTWDHPQLTKRSNRSVKRQLNLTKREIRRATGQTPTLYRPPYGDTSKRVKKIGRKLHLREELWTIDTRDWSGRSKAGIRKAALKHLRPHRRNVILMHDAVGNSPTTLKAVPGIIKGIRKKGYCLVPLQSMMPLGVVSAEPVTATESPADHTLVPITLRLDGPSQRRGAVHVHAVSETAAEGVDFRTLDQTVTVPRGARAVTFHLTVYPDPVSIAARRITINLSGPQSLRLATTTIPVMVMDSTQLSSAVTVVAPIAWHSPRLMP